MKFHYSLILSIIGIVWMSCNNDNFRCDRGETFHFIENAGYEIDTNAVSAQIPELISGQQIVFRYEKWNDCENVFDDEVYEMMIFVIPEENESFLFDTPLELSQISAYFYRTGAWFEFFVPITDGRISGTKSSRNKWDVEVDVTIRWDNPDQNVYRDVRFARTFNVDQ